MDAALFDRILHFLFITSYVWAPLVLLSFVSMWLCRLLGRNVTLSLGAIGVPVHEASHLIVALLCGQKIIGVSFYRPSSDGSLGYVNRQYRRSMLSPVFNLLIAVAPVGGGLLGFYWVTEYLLPGFIAAFEQGFESGRLGANTPLAIVALFSFYDFHKICLWGLISFSILLFCSPSSTDFQGCRSGFIFMLCVYLLLQLLWPAKVDAFLNMIVPYAQLFGSVLMAIALGMVLLFVVIFGIRRLWVKQPALDVQ